MALVQMKRLVAVSPKQGSRNVLRALYDLGCVELVKEDETLKEQYPQLLRTEPVESKVEARLQILHKAKQVLDRYVPFKKGLLTQKPKVTKEELFDLKRLSVAISKANELVLLSEGLEELAGNISRTEAKIQALIPWETLDVPLGYQGSGQTRFIRGSMPLQTSFEQIEQRIAEEVPECELQLISSDKDQQYLTALYYAPRENAVTAVLKSLGFSYVENREIQDETASQAIASLRRETLSLQKQMAEKEEKIRSLGDSRQSIEESLDAGAQELQQDGWLSELNNTEKTSIFSGWIPAHAEIKVAETLERLECAYEISDPEEGDRPPTAVKNGRFAEPFEMVTEMYGMPEYGSVIDPNPVMALFYIIFFSFIMGDAAYGILMVIGCLLGLKLMKPKGNMKKMLTMFLYCGIGSIIAGILTGGWFGDAVTAFSGAFLAKEVTIPALWFDPLKNPIQMLIFSMALGVIQILFGMGVSGWRMIKQGDVWGAVFDIGSWYIAFAGLGIYLTGFAPGLYIMFAGVLTLLLTGGRHKKGFGRITGGLGSLYAVIGYAADVLSYSRIMAMGLSGAVVAQVFNKIGAMAGGSWWGIIIFVIAFLIGHTFNIAIGMLGAYVHTSRLQYIEFFGKFYQGGGKLFQPLANRTKYVEIVRED